MDDVKLQEWPEGVKLRITYGHDKDEPCAITSYAGEWHFFEPVSIEIEPHPDGFYVPARDYDRQAKRIAELEEKLEAAARILHKAGEQFTAYANQHAAKGTADGDQKAATNQQWAQRCFNAHDAAHGTSSEQR